MRNDLELFAARARAVPMKLKQIEFTLVADGGESLREPVFVEDCSELPAAIMQAVEDFLEAHGGKLHLPLTIRVQPSEASETC